MAALALTIPLLHKLLVSPNPASQRHPLSSALSLPLHLISRSFLLSSVSLCFLVYANYLKGAASVRPNFCWHSPR
jgi:hypothetical protein